MLIGVVGKPSVGKSSFFKAATLAEVEIADYPFTTIKPHHAVGYVRVPCVDTEFRVQCQPRQGYCLSHIRFVPVELLDVAGLVPGASHGAGMGNQFLDDLNQADALIHVIDAAGATNEKGESVSPGSYDPTNDILFLEEELDQWYLRIIAKGWEKFARSVKQESRGLEKSIAQQLSGLRVTEDIAKEVLKVLNFSQDITSWGREDVLRLAHELRKRTKPMIVAANKIDIISGRENFDKLLEKFPEFTIIPCSAEGEIALKEATRHELVQYIPGEKDFSINGSLTEAQHKGLEYIKKNILEVYGHTGVQQILDSVVFDVLHMIAVFPGGVNKLEDQYGHVLPDCFLMNKGSTALDFAFQLHTDIGKGFIHAIDVRTKRVLGKEYILKNRDIIEIVTKA